jgi:hypothetical protein
VRSDAYGQSPISVFDINAAKAMPCTFYYIKTNSYESLYGG